MLQRETEKLLCRRRRFKIQDWEKSFGVKKKNDSSTVWEKWARGNTEMISVLGFGTLYKIECDSNDPEEAKKFSRKS